MNNIKSGGYKRDNGNKNPNLFLPNFISGLNYWFDAADSSSISIATGVSQWNDKSGNGFHATQGTAGKQPTYTIGGMNGHNVLTFSNASQTYLAFSGTMLPNTVAVVWKSTATPWSGFLGVLSARSTGATVVPNGAYNSGVEGVSATTKVCGIGQSTTSVYIDGVSVNTANFDTYLTGVSASPITSAHTVIYTDDLPTPGVMYYGIGIDVFHLTRSINGQVAEIIAYNRALSVVEIAILQRYLKAKWGTV